MLKTIFIYIVCHLAVLSANASNDPSPLSQEEKQYQSSSSDARAIGEPYFNAYLERDWDKFESILHTDAIWSDPTAEQLFGVERVSGKDLVISHLRSSFAGITHMRAHINRKVFTSNFAIFEADLDWGVRLRNGKTVEVKAAPFVVVLRIKDGKVIEHTDYADYAGFINEFRRIRKQ
jgi:ketosteroid isomerase-like protein